MFIKAKREIIISKTVIEEIELRAPLWLELALKGEKINAIKALRDFVGPDNNGQSLNLKTSKDIVESVLFNIRVFSSKNL